MEIQDLTSCEEMVMKAVWDAETEPDLAYIVRAVNATYHKEWKQQTVSTFLARLVKKGYVQHYRKGRVFYYQILVPQREYLEKLAEQFAGFWKKEERDVFLTALDHKSV